MRKRRRERWIVAETRRRKRGDGNIVFAAEAAETRRSQGVWRVRRNNQPGRKRCSDHRHSNHRRGHNRQTPTPQPQPDAATRRRHRFGGGNGRWKQRGWKQKAVETRRGIKCGKAAATKAAKTRWWQKGGGGRKEAATETRRRGGGNEAATETKR